MLHNHDAYAGSILVYHARLMSRIFDNDSLKKQPEKYWFSFLPASPKAKAGLGVQSLRPSARPSVPKSCHRNSSETTDPIVMKLGM